MKTLFLIVLAVLLSGAAWPRESHRAVFELTSGKEEVWDGILGNVKNTLEALGEVEIEVVAHSDGIGIVTQENEKFRKRMKDLSSAGVRFRACENTMAKKKIKSSSLHDFVTPVDSGVAEVIRKQKDGWSYVKVGP